MARSDSCWALWSWRWWRCRRRATTAVRAAQPDPVFYIGKKPEYWRQVLWHCDRADCAQPRRIPLDIFQGPPRPVMLAVAPDGRVLLVREDRVALLPPPA